MDVIAIQILYCKFSLVFQQLHKKLNDNGMTLFFIIVILKSRKYISSWFFSNNFFEIREVSSSANYIFNLLDFYGVRKNILTACYHGTEISETLLVSHAID